MIGFLLDPIIGAFVKMAEASAASKDAIAKLDAAVARDYDIGRATSAMDAEDQRYEANMATMMAGGDDEVMLMVQELRARYGIDTVISIDQSSPRFRTNYDGVRRAVFDEPLADVTFKGVSRDDVIKIISALVQQRGAASKPTLMKYDDGTGKQCKCTRSEACYKADFCLKRWEAGKVTNRDLSRSEKPPVVEEPRERNRFEGLDISGT